MDKGILFFVAFILWLFYQSGVIHIVDFGYIGVYKRGGALLDSWTEPGLHFLIPFLTQYFPVQVTLQTDMVTNIPVNKDSCSVELAVELFSTLRR
jgi:regulator of protease activity HflC (stomatin/prohibitin superfamily)